MSAIYVPNNNPLAGAITRAVEQHRFTEVSAAAVDAFIASTEDALLVLTADPARTPETLDLLVVLPEALKAHPQRLHCGVADAAESAQLRTRFDVSRLPAAVFFHCGRYVGAIEGMRDWDALQRDVALLLSMPAVRGSAAATH